VTGGRELEDSCGVLRIGAEALSAVGEVAVEIDVGVGVGGGEGD
jgi:hypothetical protein